MTTEESNAWLLDEIRRWLRDGATIRATDLGKPILQLLPDGNFNGNVSIEYPPKEF